MLVGALKAAQDGGAAVVILCDTNGGSMPEQIADAVARVRQEVTCEIGIHCHNDCDVAVANTALADSTAKGFLGVAGVQWGVLDSVNAGTITMGGLPIWVATHKAGMPARIRPSKSTAARISA